MNSISLDFFILASVLFSYVLFLVIHFSTFRFYKNEDVLKSLMNTVFIVGICHILLVTIWSKSMIETSPTLLTETIFCALLSLIIWGVLVFVHVLTLFGPYETSIRLRLVRELYQGNPQGLTRSELLAQYNSQMIMKKRLARLIASGDIVLIEKRLRVNKTVNVFFFIDMITIQLQKLLNPESKPR